MSKDRNDAQIERLKKLAALPDYQIDLTEIPLVEDWSRAVRGGPGAVPRPTHRTRQRRAHRRPSRTAKTA